MRTSITNTIYVLLFAIAIAQSATAQFTISGEFRPRAEYRNGYQKLGDSTMTGYGTILGRSRITFEFNNDKIQTLFSIQQAFVYGENPYSSDTITKNTINIYEGWFRYNFTKNFAVRVGRMGLTYDDMRIFGLSNWKQWGATHDIVNLEWKAPQAKYAGDFGFAINNTAPATPYLGDYTIKNYKYMSYMYNQKKFFKDNLVVSLLGVMDAYQKPSTSYNTTTTKSVVTWVTNGNDTVGSFTTKTTTVTPVTENHNLTIYSRGTVGATAGFKWNNLNIFANGYYQTGHYKDGRKLSASFFGGWASYRIVKPFTLLIGYEQLSGNNASDTTEMKSTVHGFATLFGTNHSFYGYMDLYQTYLGQDALHYGLNDLYGKATVQFSAKTSIEATYRWFSLPYGYLPVKTGKMAYQTVKKDLGSEVDLMFLYKPMANLELNAAYCVYMPTDTKDIVDGLKAGTGRLGQYGYLMITYKPNFFTSEKK
jgi:hypothetical protein